MGEWEQRMDDRLRLVEREVAEVATELKRNSEILDEVRMFLNRPTDWAKWLATAVSTASFIGGLIWAVWIAPLESQVERMREETVALEAELHKLIDRAHNDGL